MSELEAMNMLLRLIGSSPVNSVTTPHPDAANARTTLDRIRKQAQRTGWWFNVEYNLILSPNDRGEIVLPETYSSVTLEDKSLIQRGRKVYNKVLQTYLFTTSTTARKITIILDWDEMPEVMQEYCAYFAASQFVRDELEDPQKVADLERSAAQSLIDVKKQDLQDGQYNMFCKPRVIKARAGVQPYQRNNKRFYGDPDV